MLKTIKVNFLIFGFLVFVLMGCSAGGASEDESGGDGVYMDSFSTGSSGGVYNILGGGLTDLVNSELESVQFNATTPPSVSHVPGMIHNGEVAFGVGIADMMLRAGEGEEEFDETFDNIRHVIGLYDNVMSPVVLESSNLENINEAEGMTVGVSSDSTQSQVETLLEYAGVSTEDVDWAFLSFAEQEEALRDDNIDIGIFTSSPPSGLLEGLASTSGFRFLSIDDEVRERWDEERPEVRTSIVPGGTYPNIEGDYYHYTQYTALYASIDVPEDVVYEVLETIFDNHDRVSDVHPAGESVVPEKTIEYLDAGILEIDLLHPGAYKYFEENGYLE